MRRGPRRNYIFPLLERLPAELSCHAVRKSKPTLTEKPHEKVEVEKNWQSTQQLASTARCLCEWAFRWFQTPAFKTSSGGLRHCPYLSFSPFFFLVFLGLHPGHMEDPRLGLNQSSSHWPMPQPEQYGIWVASAAYTTAHGKAGSLTYWGRPGIEPESSWILARFINHWAMTGTPILSIS